MGHTISEVARRTGCRAVTIRYYERIGLIPAPSRGPNGYRRYTSADVDRLRFIARARDLGFTLADVGELLALAAHPDIPCEAVDRKVDMHLIEVRSRIEHLRNLERELLRLQTACAGGTIDDCRILAALKP